MDRQTGMRPFSIKLSKPSMSPAIHRSSRRAFTLRPRDLSQCPCLDRDVPGGHLPVRKRYAMEERIFAMGA